MTKKMLYVRQQRTNKVQIFVSYESIFEPQTMNFTVGTVLCEFLDFWQFTVDSSENNKENN